MMNTGRNLTTPYGNAPLNDFEALEAEVAMLLASMPLPLTRRTEIEKRMEALRVRAGVPKSQ